MTSSDHDQDFPGVDAAINVLYVLITVIGIYVGYFFLTGIRFASRLPYNIGERTISQLSLIDILVSFIVISIVLTVMTALEIHTIDVAIAGAGTEPQPFELTAVFSEAFVILLVAFPIINLILTGMNAGWQSEQTTPIAIVQLAVELSLQYVLTGTLVVVGFSIVLNHAIDSVTFLSITGPRLLIPNVVRAILIGGGYPLIFGGSGVVIGALLRGAAEALQ